MRGKTMQKIISAMIIISGVVYVAGTIVGLHYHRILWLDGFFYLLAGLFIFCVGLMFFVQEVKWTRKY